MDIEKIARLFYDQHYPLRSGHDKVEVLGAGSDDLEEGRRYLREADSEGLAVPNWPVSYGGMGLSREEIAILNDIISQYKLPDLYPFSIGLNMAGPSIIQYGNEEQKQRWLPKIRNGEEIWCQLFSEPGAGSDLASLSTRGERDGDQWIVNGQKVWSSRAHYSRWGLLLARTDKNVPKHSGITCFAIDMTAPGVDIRPLRQMNGDAHFNEVFMTDVVVLDENRIGSPGSGWSVALTTLANERSAVGRSSSVGVTADQISDLMKEQGTRLNGKDRDALVEAWIRLEVLRVHVSRGRSVEPNKRAPEWGSLDKLITVKTLKYVANTAINASGAGVLEGTNAWLTLFLTSPSLSIRGGTDEIQKNIIGQRILGLPAENKVIK